MSSLRLIALACALCTLTLTAPAGAAVVDVAGGEVRVSARPGEVNDVSVTLASGTITVVEAGPMVGLGAGFGCTPAGVGRATCSAAGVSRAYVDAGDGGDVVRVVGALGATIVDGAGDDRVFGGAHADVLVGSPGADVVEGGAGDDNFGDAGGPGADVLDGGPGGDTADYSGRADAVHVTLDGVAGDGAAGEGDDVEATVEHARGGSGADRLVGNGSANTLRGGAGDDGLDGGLGADKLYGEGGRDLVDYGTRTARVVADADGDAGDGEANENDTVGSDVEGLAGGSAGDLLVGSGAAGTVSGGAGDDTLDGARGDDDVDGGAGNDTVNGGDGNDAATGGEGRDTVNGGAGDDDLDGGDGADALAGGAGSDAADYRSRSEALTLDLTSGTAPDGDRIADDVEGALGGGGDDRLLGDAGAGRFHGGAGDDVLDGRGGGDRLEGGDGWDRADYGARRRGVVVDTDGSADDGESGEGDRVIADVEQLTGGSADDRLTGGEGRNVLTGGAGNDTLSAGNGDDELDGGDGNDTLSGGRDRDVLHGGASGDKLAGEDGDDELHGDSGNDTADGGNGHDALRGDDGNDRLTGGSGDDRLDAGFGDDELYGGADRDALAGGEGHDKVNGDDGDDDLDAGEGNDRLDGGRGPDVLRGAGGDDRLSGGDDDDRLDAGDGADKLYGGNGGDFLAGDGANDELNGDHGADRLEGGDGDDQLRGGGDADVLTGGAGADAMRGDDGQDTVDYTGRPQALRITNDGKPDDGAKDERDNVDATVDSAIGGAARDLIRFTGGWPHQLYGEGGNDTLDGDSKEDKLVGGAGNDHLIGRKGRDELDGGAGTDKLSGSDGIAETLTCGAGKKDLAVKDRSDKAVGCEKKKRGNGEDPPLVTDPQDTAPVATPSPGQQTGVRRVYGGGRFVDIPGSPGERIDRRLLKDIAYLKAKYKIAITDGLAASGHAADGEHPRGLALDIVPGPGGTWSDVDRLARWAEPRQNQPRSPFRWVGYNGDPNHGRGHHLHLSWRHSGTRRGTPAQWVEVLKFKRGRPVKLSARRENSLARLAYVSNFRLGGKPSVKTGMVPLPRCQGPTPYLVQTWKTAGRAFGIRWSILAAITEVESGHGCNMGPSSAGALGWTQFMPGTWDMWGMDADGDGRATPYSSADAIFSSARYLRASGAPRSYRKALYAYNHAQWYVDKVLATARRYR